MTWEVLHAGKFVDADGVVLERAEHEFLAHSPGLPPEAVRTIAQQEPPRLTPVPWEEGWHAAFAQTVIRIHGVEHTLRVIDHRAFEGPADRPGRPYRRRTYHIQPCDAWGGADAALPIDAMQDVPSFQQRTDVAPWQGKDVAVESRPLPGDLGALLAGGLHIGAAPSRKMAKRLSAVLASLPPAVAARMEVRLGADAALSVREGAQSSTPDAAAGEAWLGVLQERGASMRLASLAEAAAQPWPVAPSFDDRRPFDAIRVPLRWTMLAASWRQASMRHIAARRPVEPAPFEPSVAALRWVLPALVEADAAMCLGAVGDAAWRDAWRGIEEPDGWRAITRLLAHQSLDPADLAQIADAALEGPAAQTAADAWRTALGSCGDVELRALMRSKTGWARAFRQDHQAAIATRALQHLTAHDDPEHPVWATADGKALAAFLAGTKPLEKRLAALPLDGYVARHADVAANGAWVQATGRPGDPGARDDATAVCLRLLRRDAFVVTTDVRGFATAWKAFGAPLPAAAALTAGLTAAQVQACLPRVDVEPAERTIGLLLAAAGVDGSKWCKVAGNGPGWRLLLGRGGDDPVEARILADLPPHVVPSVAARIGHHPAAWRDLPPEGIVAWLAEGGDPKALEALHLTAPVPVLAALLAWSRKAQRRTPDAEGMLARHMPSLGWVQRGAVKRLAKRLEET